MAFKLDYGSKGRGPFGNNSEKYTGDDIKEAIELVHCGVPVIDAAARYGIPRATLFVYSRRGCRTHSGRCSTVFARTHGLKPQKSRRKSEYTPEDLEAAIEHVHKGMSVIDTANLFGIPRATLFARSGKGCPTHIGRCSTVSLQSKIKNEPI